MSKSLFSLACGITKAILQSPSRDAIAHALRNSGNVEGAAGLMDPGGTFRYQARKLRMQFAGYLLLNDIVEDTSVEQPFPWKLNRLSEEDWRGITEGDLFVSRVNTGVLNGLSDQLPQIYLDVCDPYHGFRLGKRCQNVEVQFSSALDSAIAELVAGFQAHPALRFLRAAHSLAQAIKPEHVSELALYVRSVVEEDPDRPTDSDIERLRGESQDQDQSANILGALGSHLYSLRKALAIVDGLLYDAFMLDRLVVISEENCFSVAHGRDLLGETSRVELQPTGRELEREPGDVVLLDLDNGNGSRLSGPALIESSRTEMSRETDSAAPMLTSVARRC